MNGRQHEMTNEMTTEMSTGTTRGTEKESAQVSTKYFPKNRIGQRSRNGTDQRQAADGAISTRQISFLLRTQKSERTDGNE